MPVAVTHNFTTGTPAVADEVDVNFQDLVTFINDDVVLVDGSQAMTGILTLPGTDPVSANQATRKAYVDGLNTTQQTDINDRVHKDGTVVMTGQLSLVGDPSAGAHAARKTYVDTGDANIASAAVAYTDQEVLAEETARINSDTARMTAPAIAANPKMVGASTVGVTDASGKITIATGLAVSIVSAVVSNGDSSAGTGIGTAILVEVDWASTIASSLVVQCLRNDNSAAVAVGISVRVNWLCLGS